jgi:hypothetical protein
MLTKTDAKRVIARRPSCRGHRAEPTQTTPLRGEASPLNESALRAKTNRIYVPKFPQSSPQTGLSTSNQQRLDGSNQQRKTSGSFGQFHFGRKRTRYPVGSRRVSTFIRLSPTRVALGSADRAARRHDELTSMIQVPDAVVDRAFAMVPEHRHWPPTRRLFKGASTANNGSHLRSSPITAC